MTPTDLKRSKKRKKYLSDENTAVAKLVTYIDGALPVTTDFNNTTCYEDLDASVPMNQVAGLKDIAEFDPNV
jgi:hypothetical protein